MRCTPSVSAGGPRQTSGARPEADPHGCVVERARHRTAQAGPGGGIDVDVVPRGDVADRCARGEQYDVLAGAPGWSLAERDDRPRAVGPAVQPRRRFEVVREVECLVVSMEHRADDRELGPGRGDPI